MKFSPTAQDLDDLKRRGIAPEAVQEQLDCFSMGFPFLKLSASATADNGILRLSEAERQEAIDRWEKYLADGGSVTKFVPASGAASRMFKSLYAYVNGNEEEPLAGSDVDIVLQNIEKMPFYDELNNLLAKNTGKDIVALKGERQLKTIVSAIVNPEGLNYGSLPKGLLSFHSYNSGEVRTPIEEQMAEGAQTASTNGQVNLHFTVSNNHVDLFDKKLAQVKPSLEKKYGVTYNIGMSVQKPATDTIAVNRDNTPFRDTEGHLVFRPGGHGALIENLSDIDSTVVFIKNIDNIVPEQSRRDTILYKKVLAGLLIKTHDTIEKYLRTLRAGNVARSEMLKMVSFLENVLFTHKEDIAEMDDRQLREYLISKFDRPLRVCGMVVNEGEPGGGPYLAYNADGSYSPQILESTQIDINDTRSMAMMKTATHFNPVDLVCYIRDIDGNPYRLKDYVDSDTGFISEKSAGGKELRALELPGLWNGAMSNWSTVFVEVPGSTFNPVKTVNDLLRPIHQADNE